MTGEPAFRCHGILWYLIILDNNCARYNYDLLFHFYLQELHHRKEIRVKTELTSVIILHLVPTRSHLSYDSWPYKQLCIPYQEKEAFLFEIFFGKRQPLCKTCFHTPRKCNISSHYIIKNRFTTNGIYFQLCYHGVLQPACVCIGASVFFSTKKSVHFAILKAITIIEQRVFGYFRHSP